MNTHSNGLYKHISIGTVKLVFPKLKKNYDSEMIQQSKQGDKYVSTDCNYIISILILLNCMVNRKETHSHVILKLKMKMISSLEIITFQMKSTIKKEEDQAKIMPLNYPNK